MQFPLLDTACCDVLQALLKVEKSFTADASCPYPANWKVGDRPLPRQPGGKSGGTNAMNRLFETPQFQGPSRLSSSWMHKSTNSTRSPTLLRSLLTSRLAPFFFRPCWILVVHSFFFSVISLFSFDFLELLGCFQSEQNYVPSPRLRGRIVGLLARQRHGFCTSIW